MRVVLRELCEEFVQDFFVVPLVGGQCDVWVVVVGRVTTEAKDATRAENEGSVPHSSAAEDFRGIYRDMDLSLRIVMLLGR